MQNINEKRDPNIYEDVTEGFVTSFRTEKGLTGKPPTHPGATPQPERCSTSTRTPHLHLQLSLVLPVSRSPVRPAEEQWREKRLKEQLTIKHHGLHSTVPGTAVTSTQQLHTRPLQRLFECLINEQPVDGVVGCANLEDDGEQTPVVRSRVEEVRHFLQTSRDVLRGNKFSLNSQETVQDDDAVSARTDSNASTFASAARATPTFELVRKPSVTSQTFPLSSQHDYKIDIYSVGVIMESKITGTRFDPELFRVEAEAPSGRVVRMTGHGHYAAQFTPDEIGRWRVSMFYDNRFMDGCPIDVCDPSQVRVRDLRGGHVGKQQAFHDSDFHSTDPEERQRRAVFNTKVDYQRNTLSLVAGDWEIDYVTGGPFVVHVTDSSDILVYGMKDGTVCSSPTLIADCTKVGDGTVTADVTYNGFRFPCKVRKDRPCVYHVSFKPRGPGTYKIWISYDGVPVKGKWRYKTSSPFVQEIAELGRPVAHGDGLYRGVPGRPLTFTVDPRGNPGPVTVDIEGPSKDVPCHLQPKSDGTVEATYTPFERGQHRVDVRVEGKPVEGELTAEVRGPPGKIPVTIDARNDGKHTVVFTPREEGKHYIDVKWSGFPLTNSPFEGFATYEPEPLLAPEREIVSLRQIPLRSGPHQDLADKDIIPLKVGQPRELSFDTSLQGPGKLTGTVRGPTRQIPVAVDSRVEGRPTLVFTPEEEGKHLIHVNWNNTPLAQSPFVGFASHDPEQPPPVYLSGLAPTHQEKQLPFDATTAGPGQLTATVHGPTRPVPAAIQDHGNGRHVLHFTPEEEGKHDIHVKWNGVPIPQSPLIGYAAPAPQHGAYPGGVAPVYLLDHTPRNKRASNGDEDIIPLQVHQEKQLHFDATKAGPGHMTATVRGPTRPIPAEVHDRGDGKPTLLFTPEEKGKHDIHVKWNGIPTVQSPLIGYATPAPQNGVRPGGMAPVYLLGHMPSESPTDTKDIIPLKVQEEKELPFDTSAAGPGVLTAAVRGPSRPIPVNVRDRGDGKPKVNTTLMLTGMGLPSRSHLLSGYATRDPGHKHRPPPVYLAGHKPRNGQPVDDIDIIPLKVNQEKQLPFDATDAGPGKLTAAVKGPTRNIPVHVDDLKNGRPTLRFTPEEEGELGILDILLERKHLIDVNWNNVPVPKSPFVGYATRDPELIVPSLTPPTLMLEGYPKSLQSSRPSSIRSDREPLKVILRGRGLKEAEVDKPAVFHVDGTQATPGTPHARLDGVRTQIPVTTSPEGPQLYKCTYVPKVPGAYLLHVTWNDHPLRGSPFKVNVRAPEQPTLGRVHRPETAKPGKLVVTCTDPKGNLIPCRFLDNLDGSSSLKMTPNMPGPHIVDIQFNNQHIMGSPYIVDIKAPERHGRVRVWGPGIENGVLNNFQSNFWVDATGAGAGELRVRLMGPKVKSFRCLPREDAQGQPEREALPMLLRPCRGRHLHHLRAVVRAHVDGSPFTVLLANSDRELDMMSDIDRASSRGGAKKSNSPRDPAVHDFLY
ncbi:hypothetical protein C0Q70_21062 [Pomacea canaliculata]|uniref:Uncharacterized protein n=1 Tax=Pomacea canaliculata TaxID=400727 RepID=A0A2T7NBG9_POMCA|nr:hypothetical protein C0Q70_21062 [Pomacea canaliculata]